MKNTRYADVCADQIDVITNFAVITNVVIKRFHCINCTFCVFSGQTNVTGKIAAGYFSQGGSTTPTPNNDEYGRTLGICPKGSYCPEASTDPIPCPAGTYGYVVLVNPFIP